MSEQFPSETVTNWTDQTKARPETYGWYLVVVAGDRHYSPMVTIAWWEIGRGYGWRDHANYVNRESRLKVLYWAPLPKMPARFERQRVK